MKRILLATTATAVVLMSTPAFAQEPTPTADETQEVTVVGMRKSMRDALATKKAQTGVVEVISAKDIGVLPDVTIAETLARLPGLNTVRDRGNDSQAAIRGLGPRMVLGLINGREMASSEPDRNVRWEIFPSEVVSGVSVYKSTQASLVSGGISGTVDIQTIRPLDYRGPKVTLRGGPVYYDGGTSYPDYDEMGYRFSGAYVTNLAPTLGFVVAASYQKQQNGYESVGGGGWNTTNSGAVTPGGPIVQTPWGASLDGKALQTERASISSSLQWRPSSNFEGRFDVLYSLVKLDEADDGGWFTDWGNWDGYNTGTTAAPGYTNNVVRDGSLVKTDMTFNSNFNSYISRYKQDMKLFATGVNGKWTNEQWTYVGDLSYSQAERYGLWQAALLVNNTGRASYDYTKELPEVFVETSPWEAARNGTLFAQNGQADTSRLRDTMWTGSLDATRYLSNSMWTNLKFGLRVADRAKEDGPAATVARATALSTTTAVSPNLFTPFNYKNFKVPTLLHGDFEQVVAALYGPTGLSTLSPDYKNTPFVSKVSETVIEAYAEANYDTAFAGLPVNGNVGVRLVDVDQSSFGPSNGVNITIDNSYTKVLPSASARFDLGDGQYVKVGLGRALSRPPLNDLRVDRSFSTIPPYTGGGGNPYLKPYIADQLDIAYENYFRSDGLFAIAAYTKRIQNYVGYDTRPMTIAGVPQPVAFTSPFNAEDKGTLSGLEITYQTPFYFIPGLEKFGVYSNAAFTTSDIKENSPAGNPFPMNGVAKRTAILDLWYADDKLEARLGVKYHSPYTVLFTWNSAGLQGIKEETSVDFSASYRLTEQVSVRFQAANLLDTPLRLYDNNNPSQIARNDVYGRHFLLDFTLKF
ncbi:TonB-dependent receptor [Asticcacaulis sp. W401b]|uniref:TonB-dependent receptor n=1 Tax=Asticcacaulis sp. W401b TaxID=3388666 RepID=UPI0039710147